ncbi:MAG: D-tyrosyl-tRNA(Tyr) deacylase [Elusimicrobia bacterium]|nr:D-tyrosyl-tRNA(Tyr) deacylase [Candidatus Liberimonas magnetica]
MKAVIQRVTKASVSFNNQTRQIARGLVVFIGIGEEDTEDDAKWLSDKILNLRIFPNAEGKFDKSVFEVRGELLVVSQFTLYADANCGRRPDFTRAAKPEKALPLYQKFVLNLKTSELKVETGEFAADMIVEIHNDGPVTIILDTKDNGKV